MTETERRRLRAHICFNLPPALPSQEGRGRMGFSVSCAQSPVLHLNLAIPRPSAQAEPPRRPPLPSLSPPPNVWWRYLLWTQLARVLLLPRRERACRRYGCRKHAYKRLFPHSGKLEQEVPRDSQASLGHRMRDCFKTKTTGSVVTSRHEAPVEPQHYERK